MKQKLTKLKGEIDNSTFRVGDFSTLLSAVDRISRQKNKIKKTWVRQVDLIDICSKLYPTPHSKWTWNIHQDEPYADPQTKCINKYEKIGIM